jgi:hypothetical protein
MIIPSLSPTGSLEFWRMGDRGSVCRQVPGLHGNAAWCACRHAPYGSAQGVGGGAFGHACGTDGGGDGLPDTAGVEVMPRDDTGTGVSRAGTGGEAVLPFPGRSYAGVGARQRWRYGDRNGTVHLLQAADPLPVGTEALEPPLLV